MAVSVRMDPVLERELEAAARRKGQTKSQFIVDAVERALGHKNPYDLLLQVREEVAAYGVGNDELHAEPRADGASTKARVRAVLQEKHRARQQQWTGPAPAAGKRGARGK